MHPTNAHRFGTDNVVDRNHGRFCRATAQTHHHIARGRPDGQTRPNGCRPRLGNQKNFPRPRIHGRFAHGPLFHAGHAIGHANHHRRPPKVERPHRFLDKVAQHGLCHEVIGNNAIAQRPHHFQHLRGTAVHIPRRPADFDNLRPCAIIRNGHHRRLLNNNALALHMNQNVHCAEVYGNLGVEKRHMSEKIKTDRV